MKIQHTLIIVFVILTSFVSGQSEKLNQLDANGKKHGAWIVWLDSDWKLAKDSMSAVYFRYNYFDHGHNIYAMGPWGGKNNKLEGTPNSIVKKRNAKQLDGEYKWFNSKGVLRSTHVLKDGWYVSFKEFYSNGKVESFFDYTKKCDNCSKQEHSWHIYSYNKEGKQTSDNCVSADKNGNWLPSRGVDN